MSRRQTSRQTRGQARYEDETRYCENCGISFIWTAEEQRRPATVMPEERVIQQESGGETEAGETHANSVPVSSQLHEHSVQEQPIAPVYCPGCRQLLPVREKERGLVKWYHRRKGYGFIVRAGAPDIYVHRSALGRSAVGRGYLAPDDLVEFSVGENRQGPVAVDVHMIDRATTEN